MGDQYGDYSLEELSLVPEATLRERVHIMLRSERQYMPRPDYIENVQKDGMRVVWRSKVASWLLEFEEEYGISQDTIAVAVNYMDRYLSEISTKKSILQLLAMGSIFIAAKLHETYPIGMGELRDLADGTYLESDIKLMELELLRVIQWRLNPVTAQSFMNHLVQYVPCERTKATVHEDAVTFLDVVIPEYEFLAFPASVQGAAAVLCAFEAAGLCAVAWKAAVAHFGILESRLVADCKQRMLAHFYSMVPEADTSGIGAGIGAGIDAGAGADASVSVCSTASTSTSVLTDGPISTSASTASLASIVGLKEQTAGEECRADVVSPTGVDELYRDEDLGSSQQRWANAEAAAVAVAASSKHGDHGGASAVRRSIDIGISYGSSCASATATNTSTSTSMSTTLDSHCDSDLSIAWSVVGDGASSNFSNASNMSTTGGKEGDKEGGPAAMYAAGRDFHRLDHHDHHPNNPHHDHHAQAGQDDETMPMRMPTNLQHENPAAHSSGPRSRSFTR